MNQGQIQSAAAALSKAIDEHGAPNSFTVGELAFGFRARMVTGQVLRDHLAELAQAIGHHLELGDHEGRRAVHVGDPL